MQLLSEMSKGTYMCAKFTDSTLDSIQEVQDFLGLLNPVDRDDLHTTICYSRVFVPISPIEEIIPISNNQRLEIWKTTDGSTCLVMILTDSEYLKTRHELCMAMGATFDFPSYTPHITLSYNIGSQYIDTSQTFDINIVINKEVVEDLNLNWASDKK